MEKTNNFFVIHNFNTVPEYLLEYCNDYMIFDASSDIKITETLEKKGLQYKHIPNTGHNITTYFQYFVDNYENLPEVICLCKGNMIDRHCSKEFFDRVYRNTYFTFLFEEKQNRKKGHLLSENQFIEENSDWYVESDSHPHKYFDCYNDLLQFIYEDPVLPAYNVFSPGACFIVRREQVLKNTPQFYTNLIKIMNYDLKPNFPSEAHQIERMLPLIFQTNYKINSWMNNESEFDKKLLNQIKIIEQNDAMRGKRFKKVRKGILKLTGKR